MSPRAEEAMVDCVTRVWALAIATAACVGLPSALVYAIVRIAAARRYLATFAMAVVLVFSVTVSAAYYPRVCADLVPWLSFLRRARGRLLRGRAGGEPSLPVPQRLSFVAVDAFPVPRQAPQVPAPLAARGGGARAVRAAGDVVSAPASCRFEHQRVPLAQRYGDRGGGMMGVLCTLEAQAPAARGGARSGGADDGVPPPPPPPPYSWQQRVPSARSHGDRASTASRMMAALPREPPAARGGARSGGADDGFPPPPPPPPPPYSWQQRVPLARTHGERASTESRMMAALPREPPAARDKARVGADVPRPPCEEQSDGGEPSKYCTICMTDVDKEETAKRLPLCLHVFHRHCIDQWLREHSTCPICRCNGEPAVIDVPPPPPPRYPLYEQQQRDVPLARRHGGDRASTSRTTMAALPREPLAASGGADDVLRPSCDGQPSKYCAICLAEVDMEETVKWLPLCLHVFHGHCIDQWLQGHSTCPICRCNALLTESWTLGSS